MPHETKNITVTLLFGLLVLISLVEMYVSYAHDTKRYSSRDTWNNVYLMALAYVVNLSTKTATFFGLCIVIETTWHSLRILVKNASLILHAMNSLIHQYKESVLHEPGHKVGRPNQSNVEYPYFLWPMAKSNFQFHLFDESDQLKFI